MKHNRSGKRPAAIVADEIDYRLTEVDVNAALRRADHAVVFLSFFNNRLKTLDWLLLR